MSTSITPRKTINEVVDFCYKYNIPELGGQIQLFESYYKSNPKTAMKEWKKVYEAYTNKTLIYYLTRFK